MNERRVRDESIERFLDNEESNAILEIYISTISAKARGLVLLPSATESLGFVTVDDIHKRLTFKDVSEIEQFRKRLSATWNIISIPCDVWVVPGEITVFKRRFCFRVWLK